MKGTRKLVRIFGFPSKKSSQEKQTAIIYSATTHHGLEKEISISYSFVFAFQPLSDSSFHSQLGVHASHPQSSLRPLLQKPGILP